jgi:hypothetical protein
LAPESLSALVSPGTVTTDGVVVVLLDADAIPDDRATPNTDPPRATSPTAPTPILFFILIM